MDPRADTVDAALHRRAWDAIPWVVNGTADDAQRRHVQQHVAACADCRAELERQQALQAAMAQDEAPCTDVDAGLQRLRSRIDQAAEEAGAAANAIGGVREGRAALRGRPRLLLAGLASVAVIEALGLVVLASGVARPSRDESAGAYRTLADASRGQTERPAIRIVARPQMSLGDLQRVLTDLDLEIVAGPNRAGAYALAPRATAPNQAPAAALDEQVVRLRATPGLLLVEPIGAQPAAR